MLKYTNIAAYLLGSGQHIMNNSILVNFMYAWNYHDNRDNKQHYHDKKISIYYHTALLYKHEN